MDEQDRTIDQRARRVAIAHRQARPTLVMAAAFTLAAGVAAVLPHRTGPWLPLHLLLVGGLLAAISGATQLLAITWSAAVAPPDALVRAQRVLLAAGVVGLAAGRELDAPSAFIGAVGLAVIAALVLLVVLLVRIRTSGTLDRFGPAIDGYLMAIGFGLLGCGAGIVMAAGHLGDRGDAVRSAHLTANLLGLVGIVIAATLPYLVATQARSKMAARAKPRALVAAIWLLATATAIAIVGLLSDHSIVAAFGYGLYVIGIAATVSLCPRVRFRQLRWAGPRLAMVAMGVVWWAGTTAALAAVAGRGRAPSNELLATLAVGGYAQILAGSLAYFAPVLRGGGHVRLAAGFRLTRSPLALVAANAAALGTLTGAGVLTMVAIGVWLADTAVRAGLLMTATTGAPTGARR